MWCEMDFATHMFSLVSWGDLVATGGKQLPSEAILMDLRAKGVRSPPRPTYACLGELGGVNCPGPARCPLSLSFSFWGGVGFPY